MGQNQDVDVSTSMVEFSTLQVRLEAARESVTRARLAFLVTTLLSMTVLVSLYNAYVSWYRGFASQESFSTNEVTKQAQLVLLEEWVKNQTVEIQLLGLRVGVSDLAFLASMSLFISTLWFFFCVRRENHVVGLLLADTDKKSKEVMAFVYHGIASHMIFLDSTGSDYPIDSLEPGGPRKGGLPFVRPSIKLLYFLPGITISACVIFDALTIFFLEAVFRYPHSPLSSHLGMNDIAWIVFIELIAIIIATQTFTMSARMLAFQNATERLIRDYDGKLRLLLGAT
jgi:hypothetical protein